MRNKLLLFVYTLKQAIIQSRYLYMYLFSVPNNQYQYMFLDLSLKWDTTSEVNRMQHIYFNSFRTQNNAFIVIL